MRLLVTRPDPEGQRTAALLRGLGHEVLLMPLLRIEPILNAELGTGPWAAVLFTSANAVRAAAAHLRFSELADLPVYTVGRRTRAAAAAAGFASVISADGDVNALVSLVASKPPVANIIGSQGVHSARDANAPPPCEEGAGVGEWGAVGPQPLAPPTHPSPSRNTGFDHPKRRSKSATADFDQGITPPPMSLPLLYCAGEDRAGDVAGALELRGLRVETALVYRATMVAELTPGAHAALASGAIDAVLHYSARTAAAFVTAAALAGVKDLSIQTRHLCLSAQVAAPLAAAGAKSIEVASNANEPALLALIGRT